MPGTISKSRRMIAYTGVLIINFMAMYLISSVGVYSYTVAGVFNNLSSVSMIFTLECVARGVTISVGGKIGDKVGHKKLFIFAVALYIVCYGIAAFATGFWMFTIARMVSGLAWGLFMMNGFVLLSAIFGQTDAPKYSGYNQSLTNQKSSPALHLVYEPTTEKGHCLFRGCELGIYPFCNPEKDNCEGLMCPYWVEKGHTS